MTESEHIAVIGMSGRFPGAGDIEAFWRNLCAGAESIRTFSEPELLAAGVEPAVLADPHYVPAKGALDGVDLFDAEFFGFSPREAAITDPQQRLFLECAWEAVEDAGYDPSRCRERIGVYAGVGGIGTYWRRNLATHEDLGVSEYQLMLANEKDFLCTRVSYKLGLTGPSVTVQTACSTSLVAVATACQSLRDYQCDMALAGASAVSVPVCDGYRYQEGMILSPDGHCRPFDAAAAGTVSGNGVGVVLLKRLEDALADGDAVRAVIRGWAVNNDGAAKAGFTAPSVDGQAEAVAEALAVAEVDPDSVGYVEAHGTGTPLGDPIEIAALTQAFRPAGVGGRSGHCAIGSVKGNLGHLDVAGGIAGLIKTVLCLEHGLIPPHLHFAEPNPAIDFAGGPFYVNTGLTPWQGPRRAGVSSFGIGGTNAHVVLEQAPALAVAAPAARRWSLLTLSARSDIALAAQAGRLARHLRRCPESAPADVAYTLHVGRRAFERRCAVVCRTPEEGAARLDACRPAAARFDGAAAVVFLFPGQGSQYAGMGRDLYRHEARFREAFDRCARLLEPQLGLDLRHLLLSTGGEARAHDGLAQPLLFAFEYALAQVWLGWGIRPRALLGHSLGEYVAACLAGVMTLEEALTLVALRGRLSEALPEGAMLAVALDEAALRDILPPDLDLAAVNAAAQCVVAGPVAAIDAFAADLGRRGFESRRLPGRTAFHSRAVAPMRGALREALRAVRWRPPELPYLSNVSGTWIEPREATDPDYWLRHLERPVRFADALERLLAQPDTLLLEVGPGQVLSRLALRRPEARGRSVASLPPAGAGVPEDAGVLEALGALWAAGVEVDWSAFHDGERRCRVPLPTYPFQRRRHWIEPAPRAGRMDGASVHGWEALIAAGSAVAQAGRTAFENADYRARKAALEALCVAYVQHALLRLGAFGGDAAGLTAQALSRRCGVLPCYRQLLPRCLNALVSHGRLQRDGDRYHGLLPLADAELAAIRAQTEGRWSDDPQWVELVGFCGERYAEVLTGVADPRELLFTGRAYETLQNVYRDSREARYLNTVLRALLRRCVAALPPDGTVRILEIGAGTGATSAELLPELPPRRTRYTYTDVGPSFLAEAGRRFAGFDFIEYRRLDIDRAPREQGFETGYDVVIAANVLHATRDLDQAIVHARSLLAPGGVLLLVEITRPELLFFDVAFPVMDPFDGADPLRDTHPFLTPAQWRAALLARGFERVASLPDGAPLEDHVIVARATDERPTCLPNDGVMREQEGRQAPAGVDGVAHTPIECEVMAQWQVCLGVSAIGVDDDFFELGGDSLMAVQLLGALRERFGVPLPSHALLQAPTPAQLSELIAGKLAGRLPSDGGVGSVSPLVMIRAGSGDTGPLFLVHPAGGHVYWYRELAGCLGDPLPVWGIRADVDADGAIPAESVEEMAARYIDSVRAVHRGPYRLAGASFGGLVAFEMARQLDAVGERVDLLAVIDAPCPGRLPENDRLRDDVDILAYLLSLTEGVVPAEKLRQLPAEERIRYFLEHGRLVNRLLPETSEATLAQYLRVFRDNLDALARYRPLCYPGDLLYFCALERNEFSPGRAEHGWSELVGGRMEVFDVPGNHITMNHLPHVHVIGKVLNARMGLQRDSGR